MLKCNRVFNRQFRGKFAIIFTQIQKNSVAIPEVTDMRSLTTSIVQ